MTPARIRLVLGLALAAFGLVMIFSPLEVAEVLKRPPTTKPAMINLRASWGGTVLGLGCFLAWLPALRPWGRTLVGLLGWVMAGVGFARLVGFVLDGGPDGKQWVWLIAEILIAAACAIIVRRGSR
jgi:hypothetical protein